MRLTLLIPAINEVDGIERTLKRFPRQALEQDGHSTEILVVDGGSSDGTAQRAEALGARVVVDRRRGYGRAYKTGFAACDGDLVVTADADDTYPLDGLPEFLKAFREQRLDFATLDRFAAMAAGSMSPMHRFGNHVLSTTARLLYGARLHDSQSGMWILNRRALDALPFDSFADGMAFSQELKLAAYASKELRCAELPGRYYPRVGEAKLASWRDGTRNLGRMVRQRFRRRVSGKAGLKKERKSFPEP